MQFLYFLESIRTGFGDVFFSLITRLGEEVLFIVLALFFLWCCNKQEGYYLLTVGFLGIFFNQMLKMIFRIPRPWVKDPNFTIVESAREAATGYSFPSGHTQTAVGAYGAVARWEKNRWLRIVCIVAIFLVGLSRMYLGVHTPLDVLVSLAVGGVLVFALYPLFRYIAAHPKWMHVMFAVLLVLSVGFVLFMELYAFPADTDPHNLASACKSAYMMLGCTVGVWLIYFLDNRYLHYSVEAPFWGQVLKLVLGLALALVVKSVVKEPLLALTNQHESANAIRYFLLVIFAGVVWPLTFPLFARIGKKKASQPTPEK